MPRSGHFYLYELACSKGFIYIGVTKHLDTRLKQHFSGQGSKVTSKFRPYKIIGAWDLGEMTYQDAEAIEKEYTLFEMFNRRKESVRGSIYCHIKENTRAIIACNVIKGDVSLGYEKVVVKKPKLRKKSTTKVHKKLKTTMAKPTKNYHDKIWWRNMTAQEQTDWLYERNLEEQGFVSNWDAIYTKVIRWGEYKR